MKFDYVAYIKCHFCRSLQEMNRQLFAEQGNSNITGDIISEKYIELYGSSISDFSHIFGMEMTDFVFGCPSRALAR